VRSGAIRTDVLEALSWLRAAAEERACSRIVLVAHSQGAAITLDALGGIHGAAPTAAAKSPPLPRLSALVTFGAGINKLAGLQALRERPATSASNEGTSATFVDRDPIRLASLLLVGTAVVGSWFWHLLVTRQMTVSQTLWVPAVFAGASLLLGGLVIGARALVHRAGRWQEWLQRILIGGVVALFLAGVGSGIWYSNRSEIHLWPFFALFYVMLLLQAAFRTALSERFHRRLISQVHAPPGVDDWRDFWASADPVPGGPTRTLDPKVPASVKLWNEASLLNDHVRYWDNRADFVLPVVRILAANAESRWATLLPPCADDSSARSQWRTGWLRAARWLVAGSFFLVAYYRGDVLEQIRSSLVRVAKTRFAFLETFGVSQFPWAPLFRWSIVILAGSLAYAVVRMLWRSWVRSEHALILDHRQLTGVPIRLYAFGVVLLIVLLLSFFAATAVWSWPPGPWRLDLSDAFLLLWSLFTWCLIVFWAMTRIFPPPGRSVLPGRPTEVPRSHDAPSETR